MKNIVLISCVKKKSNKRRKARDLYISDLFKKSLRYALSLAPDQIFILSAKYGLVGLDDEIEPYELTLNTMSASEIRSRAAAVLQQLGEKADLQHDQFVILAGKNYRKHLLPHLANVRIPFEGLSFGERLHELGRL